MLYSEDRQAQSWDVDILYQQTVDAVSNGRDLRPIVQAIMAAENWILERLPAGQKLVVLIGEDHKTTTHIALQQALIAGHIINNPKKDPYNFAYGYEYHHDYGSVDIRADTVALVDDFVSKNHETWGEEQTKRLFRFIRDNSVSMQFNDISWRTVSDGFLLDQEDEFTRSIIKKYASEKLGDDIYRWSKENGADELGISLSNLAMVSKASEHIKKTGAKIYIQQCGYSHMFGDTAFGFDYNDSLSRAFQKARFVVLSVFPSAEKYFFYVPQEAKAVEHMIRVSNLATTQDDSQQTWDGINAQSGGILKDPSKIKFPAFAAT